METIDIPLTDAGFTVNINFRVFFKNTKFLVLDVFGKNGAVFPEFRFDMPSNFSENIKVTEKIRPCRNYSDPI